jgi:hypothetical protein
LVLERAIVFGDAHTWLKTGVKPKFRKPTIDDMVVIPDRVDSDDDDDIEPIIYSPPTASALTNTAGDGDIQVTNSTNVSSSTRRAQTAAAASTTLTGTPPDVRSRYTGANREVQLQADLNMYDSRRMKFKNDCKRVITILVNIVSDDLLIEIRGHADYDDSLNKNNIMLQYQTKLLMQQWKLINTIHGLVLYSHHLAMKYTNKASILHLKSSMTSMLDLESHIYPNSSRLA